VCVLCHRRTLGIIPRDFIISVAAWRSTPIQFALGRSLTSHAHPWCPVSCSKRAKFVPPSSAPYVSSAATFRTPQQPRTAVQAPSKVAIQSISVRREAEGPLWPVNGDRIGSLSRSQVQGMHAFRCAALLLQPAHGQPQLDSRSGVPSSGSRLRSSRLSCPETNGAGAQPSDDGTRRVDSSPSTKLRRVRAGAIDRSS
jgi:hypothetical protein